MYPRDEEEIEVITPYQYYKMVRVYGAMEGERCGDCFHCWARMGTVECALARGRLRRKDCTWWGEDWLACGRFVRRGGQGRLFG